MPPAIDYNIQADIEAEEAAIAVCLVQPDAPKRFLSLVQPTDMISEDGPKAYGRMAELVAAGEQVNIVSMARGGISPTWLHDIIRGNIVTGSVTLDYWAEFIQRQGRARYVASKAFRALQEIQAGKHPDDVAYELASSLRETIGTSQKARTRSLNDVISEEGYPAMREWMEDPRKLAGPASGIDRLDTYLGGLGPGRLIAIGADTGIGKSAFIQHIARSCARADVAVHVISTEMSDREVFFRMAFMEAGWDKLAASKRGHVRDKERDDMLDGMESLAQLPVYLTELRGMTIDALEAEVHRVHEQHRTEVVILDLLNGLPTRGENRAQGIAENTSRLKQMAEAERVCLAMTAHINRESAKGIGEQGLHSFKDAGAIEQDADQALILVPTDESGARMAREDVARLVNGGHPVDMAIRIVKNRHGAEGTVGAKLHWGHGGRIYPVEAAS